jgi:hypothetical protein
MAEQVISRIKVMAELDIAERRVPQDGRFKVRKGGREIDFRVSIMPRASIFFAIVSTAPVLIRALGPESRSIIPGLSPSIAPARAGWTIG